MKIALVTPYDYPYPGGVTEHIRNLDRVFRARGHDTRIIAPSTEPRDALASNVITVSHMVQSIPVNGSTARLSLDAEVAGRVQAILNDEKFDVVHLHEPEAPLLGWAMLHSSRAVNVGTFHAYCEDPDLYEYAQPFMQWMNQRLDGRIFVSRAVRDAVAAYLPGESRVIPNGIDYARFAAPNLEPIAEFDDGRPTLLFVGRLDARKGFAHLLGAYPAIKHAIPDARLLAVGAFGAEDKARWAEQVRANDLRDVHLIGRVSREELPRYYRTATIFCAPSTGSESFGIVLLEAMAAGLPIVASDIAGYRSVMKDGVEGRLVPPREERSLAEAIIALVRDAAQRDRMATLGHATAARFDWQLVAPRVLDYYAELIHARQARRYTVPNPHANGVSAALDGLMTGLARLAPLEERRAPTADRAPVRVRVSARVNDLLNLEWAIQL